ncbi:PhoB family transcriptional regulator [Fictibacillus enclensis]|uniref:PhoB family transcriptional regulator n=1 Tax=Fictibacillus enclensis TaxID=1017270 RepID=A0A0V8JFZ0_9BACL|nr:response regulator transcription factor [Fictibacillus enclensis]KSU85857.1 PhoB family transcriptional regulator [Fictibacillus enclensis]
MKQRILVVEDEVQIAKVLKIELEYEAYDVHVEHDGQSGLEQALREEYNLILLDVMLPKLSGVEMLRRLRKAGTNTPVILLTARNSTLDKVMGLDLGANDYVTKPFVMEELLARVRSTIRYYSSILNIKAGGTEGQKLFFKDLSVDTETREVSRNGTSIFLTPKEYDLLVYLLHHKNKIVTRDGIITNVWGYEFEGETNVIDVYIRHLRKKLKDNSPDSLIQTVRGVGYTMKEK